MTKELERKVEAMVERNTEKEREHAIVAFISFGIPKEKILEKGYTEEEYTKVKKKLLS